MAEHDNNVLKEATLNALTAAAQFGGPVSVLVAGKGIGAVVEKLQRHNGISEVSQLCRALRFMKHVVMHQAILEKLCIDEDI